MSNALLVGVKEKKNVLGVGVKEKKDARIALEVEPIYGVIIVFNVEVLVIEYVTIVLVPDTKTVFHVEVPVNKFVIDVVEVSYTEIG